MKGFHSARSARLALALAYFLAHLPFLAPSLEDIDSINFALGLRDFDVAAHQPHPPGYAVYIALGRMSLAAIEVLAPALDAVRAEALALGFWSAAGGAVALGAVWMFFSVLPAPRGTAMWATALLACSPLFWIAGLRPMSDLPGLALALVALALIACGGSCSRGRGNGSLRPPAQIRGRVLIAAGAFVAGVAAGVRAQTLLMTVPLLILVGIGDPGSGIRGIGDRGPGDRGSGDRGPGMRGAGMGDPRTPIETGRWRIRAAGIITSIAALAAGGLSWILPLVVASGGPDGYMRALAAQAGEDFTWVDMLWANPTPRHLARSVYETLVLPWSAVPLAAAVGIAAVVGAGVALVRERPGLSLLLVAFGPYFAFHLLLQETFTVRYALPVLPMVAWLASRGALAAGRYGHAAAGGLVAFTAVISLPAGVAYGREAHPAFRAIDDMRTAAASSRPAAIHSHYSLRRPLQAAWPPGVPVVEPPRQAEWLGLADYWRGGGTDVVWFLADPRRTDLDSIDSYARRPVRYRWAVGDRPELSGTRPLGVDWYRFEPPLWFAVEGWSLTPETGGLARARGTGLDSRPIDAYVLRGRGPLHMMVGGGYVEPTGVSEGDVSPREGVAFELSIDGIPAATWTLAPKGDARFLQFFDVPSAAASASDAGYATFRIAARSESGGPVPAVAVTQFDVQPTQRMIYGFGEGWHEAEYDNTTGRRWRWTSDRSVIRVSPAQGVRLTLSGEDPLRYFDEPPAVRITAGGRTVATFRPQDDFRQEVVVPEQDVAAGGGAIAIEVDRVYLPAESEGSGDRRRLGLRLLEIAVHQVYP